MLILGGLGLTLASAFLLYGLNYDTRLLEERVRAQERAIEDARSDIAILKAERAHLARPDRIAPLAHAQGLRPASDRQLAPSPEDALARLGNAAATRDDSSAKRSGE
jgi:cell division protein FtsL